MRTEDEIRSDVKTIQKIEKNLDEANNLIGSLSYIKRSEKKINQELEKLIPKSDETKLGFDIGAFTRVQHQNRSTENTPVSRFPLFPPRLIPLPKSLF